MALNQPHFLEKVTGFSFFSQCFLFSLYKPLCTEEGRKIRRRGALLCYSSMAPPFTFKLFDGGLLKAELGSGSWSKYVSQWGFNLTRGKESAIKDTIHRLSHTGRFFARKFEMKFYPLVGCCNMHGTSGNIEVLHLLSSTDKQEYSNILFRKGEGGEGRGGRKCGGRIIYHASRKRISRDLYRRIFVTLFASLTYAYHYLMTLIKYKLWILKGLNCFSYHWKFELNKPNGFGLSSKNSTFSENVWLINFFATHQFRSF